MTLRSALVFFALTLPACTRPAPAVVDPESRAAPMNDGDREKTREKAREKNLAATLVGTTPPEWSPDPKLWLNTSPLTLAELRGKVVLVRWWMADCPYCSATAPALRDFEKKYAPRGLVVVGMYHYKGDAPFDPRVYRDTALEYGFTFPLAFDPDMRTLQSWTRGVDTGWTSMTFLIDKNGVIRNVHPGGSYVAGDADYVELQHAIEEQLAKNP